MTTPIVAQKGCVLDLSLAGSRVAIVHTIKYPATKPYSGTSAHSVDSQNRDAQDHVQRKLQFLSITSNPDALAGRHGSTYNARSSQQGYRLGNFDNETQSSENAVIKGNTSELCQIENGNQINSGCSRTLSRDSPQDLHNVHDGEKNLTSKFLISLAKNQTIAKPRDLEEPSRIRTSRTKLSKESSKSTESVYSASSTKSSCDYDHGRAQSVNRSSSDNTSNKIPEILGCKGSEEIDQQLTAVPVLEKKEKRGKKKRRKKSKLKKMSSGSLRVHSALVRKHSSTPNSFSGLHSKPCSPLVPIQAICQPIKVLQSSPKQPSPIKAFGAMKPMNAMQHRRLTNVKPVTKISLFKSISRDTDSLEISHPSTHRGMDNNLSRSYSHPSDMVRVTKVYLSERQSGVLKELGLEFPCAPPATPMPALHQLFEYIPCMNDIRSQRAVKVQLEALGRAEKQKQERVKEEKMRQEKQQQRDKVRENRKQQRLEIYALNKVMTDLEHKNFEDFCKKNGLNFKL